MTRWPYPPEQEPYDVARRNFRRRWDVLKEHVGRDTGLYRFVEWLNRKLGA